MNNIKEAPFIGLKADKPCPYHKKGNHSFLISQLGPEGLCRQIYYAAYPFCFAFAYGAFKNKNSMLIRCPRERGITFVIKKSPLSLTARFKN
ncbi:MAG: hypothetical protein ABH843_05395, partial [Candidatus Omnitrophota bacterium]